MTGEGRHAVRSFGPAPAACFETADNVLETTIDGIGAMTTTFRKA